jgi:hypothetical protein
MLGSQRVSELFACPFCRQLYTPEEADICPECDLEVKPLAELPPSHDADLVDDGPIIPVAPEDELLSWTYTGRGRGALLIVALIGLALFLFAPWLHESAPEIRTLTGFEFSRLLGWIWAGGIAWFIMVPLVVTRRTIRQMRGARVAVAFLAAMVLLTVLTRIGLTPRAHPLLPVRVAWGWGMYAAGFLSALALFLAYGFGGSTADMPTHEMRPRDETVH